MVKLMAKTGGQSGAQTGQTLKLGDVRWLVHSRFLGVGGISVSEVSRFRGSRFLTGVGDGPIRALRDALFCIQQCSPRVATLHGGCI